MDLYGVVESFKESSCLILYIESVFESKTKSENGTNSSRNESNFVKSY